MKKSIEDIQESCLYRQYTLMNRTCRYLVLLMVVMMEKTGGTKSFLRTL